MTATIPPKSDAKLVGLSQITRAVLFLACLAAPLFAQDVFIAGTGSWSQPTAWSYDRLPTQSDDCVIPANSNVTGDAGVECNNFSMATGSILNITSSGYLFPFGANFVNQGTINIGQGGNGLNFYQSGGTVTITGGGAIALASGHLSTGSGLSETVVNVDNVINGQGCICVYQLTNQKTINANVASNILEIYSTSTSGVTNTGTLEASNGGILQLVPSGGAPPFTNTGGIIQALNGSTVQLWGYVITGGTLSTTGTGTIQESDVTTLNNLTSNANFLINTSDVTILQGTIVNNGTITAPHGGLQINGTVTLKGSGAVTGGDGALIHEFCCTAANLILQQPLSGGGSIGDTSFTLTNQSTVNANNPATYLTLAGNPETNTGTLEASSGATLEIQNTVNNVGGTITAQNGSTVLLDYNGTVNGGTLTTSGTGSFQTTSGTLDGSTNTVTNAGLYSVASGTTLSLKGTINNTGTFALGGGCLAMSSPTTLTGSGTVQMNGNSCLFGWALTNNLTNKSTIEGSGSIGDSNPMGFTNAGTVIANQSTPLTIVSAGTGFSNTGSLVVNAGSEVDINGQLKNLSKGTLTGGTFSVAGTMVLENAAYTTIATNSANITLTGVAAQISNGRAGPSALAAVATNNSKGALSLQSGQVLSTTASFSNKGTLTVGTGSGFGTAGTYTQTGGTTTIDGVISAPNGFTLKTGKLYGTGTISGAVNASAAVTTGDSITAPGVLSVSSYSQTSTGSLTIPILSNVVGTGYGQLASTGAVSLAGKLVLKRKSTYVPTIGDTFTIVTGSSVSGTFASPVLTINSHEHFQINYNSNSVTLTVVAGP